MDRERTLRDLLTLPRTGADRLRMDHLHWKFLAWYTDFEIPEVRQLAHSGTEARPWKYD